MSSRVTARHHAEMEDLGFTIIEGLFSTEDMADLAAAVEAYEKRMNEGLKEHGDFGISRANEITFNDHLAERDPLVREFCMRDEWVDVCTAFLGPDVDLYWNQTVFKHPEADKIFPWHQDDAYTPVTPAPYLTLWLAINDATPENGCISVLPGSWKKGLLPHEQSSIGLVGHSADHPDQGMQVPVKAGSVIAFWSLTLHKSGPNRSQGMRKAYVIQYSKAGLRYVESGDLVPDLLPLARDGQSAERRGAASGA